MKKLLLALLFLLPSAALAGTITGVNGTVAYGNTLGIVGSGFSDKPVQEQTYFFANFEDASADIAGTTWCVVSNMGGKQNVQRKTTNCFEGGGCAGPSIAMDLSKNFTANVNHPDVGVGGQVFVSWVWRWYGPTDVPTNVNWKTWRWWPAVESQKNNTYGGQQVDTGYFNGTESERTFVTGEDRFYTTRITPQVGATDQIEYDFQLNSGVDIADGKIIAEKNGVNFLNTSTWRSHTSGFAANGRNRSFYLIHMVITGTGVNFPSNGDFRYDDLILDTSWCAAYVTTDSGGTGKKYWLPVQTWSSAGNFITVKWAQNAFASGTTVYLRIRNKDRTTSAGFPIVVSQGYTAEPPPEPTPSPPPVGGSSADVGLCPCLP